MGKDNVQVGNSIGEMSDVSARSEQAADISVPAIEMVDLCKSFGKFQAVDHLSLTVQQGEIFGLLGPNGSGKTTTINMVSGLSVPTSGKVRVMGYEIPHDARRVRQILGSVPQETALYEELSAWANLDFHADLFGIPRKEKKERITKILELVQLLDRKDSRVGTFSGGMKRRLALGRALLHGPQLIYLDEPTLGVDVQSRRAIWDYILSLRDQGKTVLITTNYLEEAQALCERIAIIDHGKLIAVDTPNHLKQTYGGSMIELETATPSASKELLLSPTTSAAIIAGKVLAGFVISFVLGLLVLGLGYVLGWTQPVGVYWLTTLLTLALVALFSAGLGVALGALIQRVQPTIPTSILTTIYMFFLAGGIGVLAFEPIWLQNIAAFVPLTYGIHALQMAIFYSSSDQLGRDVAVLVGSAFVTLSLGVFAMRRGIAQ